MTEPIVKFQNIHKSFGDVEVLKGINLDIHPAEKVAVIGPSGSGKTTIIRMLMTLEEPTDGDIIVAGRNLWKMEKKGKTVPANENHLREIRGDIGMVFQHFNLFPHMTILENCMTAPINVKKEPKEEVKKRSIEMLERVGLGDKVDNYPSQLSGGQKQRVAMARALVMRPKIMLFDEVTSALDPELVGEVLNVIRDIAKNDDMAMILVTHEMDFALDIADKVLFLDEGIIAEQGTASEVIEHSENDRLQEFLHRFRG
ncbi:MULTISPECIES: ectoine/hydroxyectoine ABC transporter ATP-binding protein EhuA [Oceanobacillus]|uniref:Ectoine/hydroxyectoine ABC transporter ATP-binding protein EhuA n=1 Tax=Oceanobacillus kimchii TaxID=746691 RepID=A0ABQ5TH07_9BACI|nr:MULTISPECIES: ectoine/hydroxyectoine ABC transporter ATP-binding protein EhuA [Oceanobacillus]MBT2652851.1 ectoine/hydroxyectoine ABC transporter ATP-binding protein EhuA [Oceanobacillus sp. ISL-73]MCT1577395.1 ectoine/hydroxyectoine ABC transporter ATP-binding protein EhuA [Oceanobacillus kimchii]MCT2137001.1 ectoine/hydroxyectoine ABC transporter ATP-binding protein EhuA [Oceanobacillus kimchii]OEH53596.1 ectoine/hydroxyectoine ABC transporter ATP-binding protein EhuA [Oceanobacillus sp. E